MWYAITCGIRYETENDLLYFQKMFVLYRRDFMYAVVAIYIAKVAKIAIKTQSWLLDLKFCNQLVTAKLVLEDRL